MKQQQQQQQNYYQKCVTSPSVRELFFQCLLSCTEKRREFFQRGATLVSLSRNIVSYPYYEFVFSNALSGTESAIMILHLSLSSVIRSKAMLSLLFPVTKELKLSRNVILWLPLLLVPSILPVRDRNSSPLWRHKWPKNFSCLFLIVFMRDLSWFVSSNIDSFVLFSFHSGSSNSLGK